MTFYGDRRQTRSSCYASDTVDGLCRRLVSNDAGAVNLGNREELSMLDLAGRSSRSQPVGSRSNQTSSCGPRMNLIDALERLKVPIAEDAHPLLLWL